MNKPDKYREDLNKISNIQIYRKYILDSECYALSANQHLQLKEAIMNKYELEYTDVFIVGSAKLGFSIKPSRRYGEFCDESDIDVAIVSERLFTKIWQQAYAFEKTNSYWEKKNKFFNYLSHGWIRPDKFPISSIFPFSGEWWEFFRTLTKSERFGPYKISAGVYHSHFFLREYQTICINQCKEEQ